MIIIWGIISYQLEFQFNILHRLEIALCLLVERDQFPGAGLTHDHDQADSVDIVGSVAWKYLHQISKPLYFLVFLLFKPSK